MLVCVYVDALFGLLFYNRKKAGTYIGIDNNGVPHYKKHKWFVCNLTVCLYVFELVWSSVSMYTSQRAVMHLKKLGSTTKFCSAA